MMLRVLVFAATACAVNIARGDHTIDNRALKEWKVAYGYDERWSLPNFSTEPRPWGAIRLKISPDGSGGYQATIRLYQVNPDNSYTLLGRADDVPLTIQGGDDGHRRRIAFQSGATDTTGGISSDTTANNPQIRLNGIWQRGRKTGNADSHVMQVKVRKLNAAKAVKLGEKSRDCEDDPDSDVLEEGGDQGDSDNGPTDP